MASWLHELERDGACVVPSVVDATTIERTLGAVSSGGDELSRRGNPFARRNVLDIPAIAAVARLPAVRELIEPVLGKSARPVRGLLFDKTPQANWTVPWHQDRSIAVAGKIDIPGYGPWSTKAGVVHVQPPVEVLRSMLTIRIHLDDCGPDNGPLRVVPGTHHDLLDAAMVDAAAAGPQRALTCPAGGAVLMRPLVLHASSPATSPNHRRGLDIEYSAGELPGGLRWRFAQSASERNAVAKAMGV